MNKNENTESPQPTLSESSGATLETSQYASHSIWHLVVVLVFWAGIVFLGQARYSPPAPVSNTAPFPDEFSAERADVILEELVGDGIPHPADSAQNKVVRKRIIRLLEGWGYEVQQHETENTYWRTEQAVPLVNLMARLPGKNSENVIMLAAHYDSNTGPGASDDGVGMAALLEIARMMKSRSQPANDIIFLITDGEEMGLLGADKWVEEHPWAKEVDVAINLEARGTDGPSLMFETSENSRWLIEIFAKHVERPMASSLFYEIYKFLPNDTDFTIFKRAEMQGYNFAFIGNVKNYHTLEDNFENVNRGSLQHHGQNSWALIRELAERELETAPKGNAVYFDLFGWFMIWWPAEYSVYLGLAGLVLVLLTLFLRASRETIKLGGVVFAMAGVIAFFVVSTGVAWAVASGFQLDQRFDNPWVASPVPVSLAIWSAPLAGMTFLVALIGNKFGPFASERFWFGKLIFWMTVSTLMAAYFSGASYLFIVPGLLAAPLGFLLSRNVGAFRWNLVWFPMAVAILWLPMERLFYDAVGFGLQIAAALRIGFVLTALLPLLIGLNSKSRLQFGFVALACFLASVCAAVLLNPA